MKNEKIQEILETTAGTILEESAYLFAAPMDQAAAPDPAQWECRGVSITFTQDDGSVSGELHMWYGDDLAAIAAANMLGLDESDSTAAEKGGDALGEILNIFAGNFLTALYGDDVLFTLSSPEMLDQSTFDRDEEEEHTVWLEAEDFPVLFVLNLN
ncbi:MAG: chemotaxis protein CheX [Fibrobacterota bacterium]